MQANLDQQVKSTQYCLCSHKPLSVSNFPLKSIIQGVEGSFPIGSLYFTFMTLAVGLENVTDATW